METRQNDTPEEQELRVWLARKLRLEDVPAPLWRLLKKQNFLSEAKEYPHEKEKVLLKPAKELLRFSTEMVASQDQERACKEVASDTAYVPQPLPGDPVYERARAAAPYLLKHLETLPLVKNIRRRLGAPLSEEEARDLLCDPESARGLGPLRYALPLWDGLEEFTIVIDQGSLAWELLGTVNRLPPGPWLPERLAWWILTRDAPEVHPLQVRTRGGDHLWPMITLTVPACATAEAVGALHKKTKDRHWASATPLPALQEEAKGHARPTSDFAPTPSPRRLAVFRFVAEQGDFRDGAFERGLGWRPLMELWNQQLPENHDWRYADVRNFSRDFRAAKKALFGTRRA